MLALDRNSAAFDLPPVRGRALDYLIASTPHSGSKLLSEALHQAGSAGAPQEYFGREPMADFAKRWGVGTIDSYVRALRKHRTTDGGVFGFTAHYHQFEDQIGPDLMEDHFAGIQPILFLRRDRRAQAAEWAQATLLGRANTGDGQESATDSPRYDPKLVDDLADQIAFEERGWRDYFAAQGVTPHTVFYEDLMLDFAGTVGAVFEFLGIEGPAGLDDKIHEAANNPPIDLWAWRSRRGLARGGRRTPAARRAAGPPSKAWASSPQPVSLLTGP